MDPRIESIEKEIGLLQQLIQATPEESEKELRELDEKLTEALTEKGRIQERIKAEAKAKADADEAEKAAAQQQSKMKVIREPLAKVVATDNYKGWNMKFEVGEALKNSSNRINPGIHKVMAKDPAQTEKMLKMMVDLMDSAGYNPRGKAAMQEGADDEGGYLTPTEQRSELLSYARETSLALREATHYPMNSDVLTVPVELTSASVAITAEESEATESEPTFAQATLTAKKIDAYSVASRELMDDSSVPLAAILLSQLTEAVGKTIDSVVFLGTGDPMSGIFTAAAGYSQTFGSGSTHWSELLEADVRLCISKIPEERLDNAKWYIHRTPLWQYFRALKDDNGAYMFNESRQGQAAPDTIWGYPRVGSSQMLSTSATGTALGVFGNLKGVIIGDRLSNISLMVDPYSRSTKAQVIFILYTRWGFSLALANYFSRLMSAAS